MRDKHEVFPYMEETWGGPRAIEVAYATIQDESTFIEHESIPDEDENQYDYFCLRPACRLSTFEAKPHSSTTSKIAAAR